MAVDLFTRSLQASATLKCEGAFPLDLPPTVKAIKIKNQFAGFWGKIKTKTKKKNKTNLTVLTLCYPAHSALSWPHCVRGAELRQRGGALLAAGSRGAAARLHPQLHRALLDDRARGPEWVRLKHFGAGLLSNAESLCEDDGCCDSCLLVRPATAASCALQVYSLNKKKNKNKTRPQSQGGSGPTGARPAWLRSPLRSKINAKPVNAWP